MSSDDWGTPRYLLEEIRRFFGGEIGLDPCSNGHSIVNASRALSGPPGGVDDGLLSEWVNYQSVFANPPYSKRKSPLENNLMVWTRKMKEEAELGAEIISLLKDDSSTRWMQENVLNHAQAICHLSKRVKHIAPPDSGKKTITPNFPSCLVYWSPRLDNIRHFRTTFRKLGFCIDLAYERLQAALIDLEVEANTNMVGGFLI